jgi:putative peptidoglycan lipid II flippase
MLALGSLVVNAAVSFALYKPLGIAGAVLGTAVSNAVLTWLEAIYLRRELGGLEIGASVRTIGLMLLASVVLAGLTYFGWYAVDTILGRSLIAQLLSVGTGLALGAMGYAVVVLSLRIPEAAQVLELFAGRLPRRSR